MPLTAEQFIESLEMLLYTATDLKFKADLVIEWMKKNRGKNKSKDRDVYKIMKEIRDFLQEREYYYVEKTEAIEAIRGNKKLEKKFEIAMTALREEK